MNKTIQLGRVTRDPELKKTQNNVSVTSFSLAVNRAYKNEDGENVADFHNVVAWKETAEAICKYVKKGHRILIEGRVENRTYETSNGETRTITEIIADKVEFVETKEKTERETFGKDPVHGQERVTPTSEDLPF